MSYFKQGTSVNKHKEVKYNWVRFYCCSKPTLCFEVWSPNISFMILLQPLSEIKSHSWKGSLHCPMAHHVLTTLFNSSKQNYLTVILPQRFFIVKQTPSQQCTCPREWKLVKRLAGHLISEERCAQKQHKHINKSQRQTEVTLTCNLMSLWLDGRNDPSFPLAFCRMSSLIYGNTQAQHFLTHYPAAFDRLDPHDCHTVNSFETMNEEPSGSYAYF